MRIEDFDLLAALVRQHSGRALTKDKAYWLTSRLAPVARKWNCRTLGDLAQEIRARRDEAMIFDIVEATLAAETSFFGDPAAFAAFGDAVLPQLLQSRAGTKTIRIWSAGCGTGQEAYSLAMLLLDRQADWAGWTIEIVGTDLSHAAIARARAGTYSHFEVQRGLPTAQLIRYFSRAATPQDALFRWDVQAAARQLVRFGVLNLLQDPAPQLAAAPLAAGGPFDVIVCRNVISGLEAAARPRVLDALGASLAADGTLFLDAAETMADGSAALAERFRPVAGQRGLYIKHVRA